MVVTLVTMVTSNGTISVARNTTNSTRLNGNCEERERVPGEDRGEHLTDGDDERDDEAVLQVRAHVPGVPGVLVAAPLRIGREQLRRLAGDVDGPQQRVDDRDVDREQHDHRQHGEQRVATDLAPHPTTVQRVRLAPQRSYDTLRSSSRICSSARISVRKNSATASTAALPGSLCRCSVS